ncbi:hypothetical protein SISNIDRAFT_399353, partial [Sistotremastrum niveocremeum HHB9708]
CPGLMLIFEPGHHPLLSYPWILHFKINPPWSTLVEDSIMFIRSRTCLDRVVGDAECCRSCADLMKTDVLQGILSRDKNGVHENSPHHFQPISGLLAI